MAQSTEERDIGHFQAMADRRGACVFHHFSVPAGSWAWDQAAQDDSDESRWCGMVKNTETLLFKKINLFLEGREVKDKERERNNYVRDKY